MAFVNNASVFFVVGELGLTFSSPKSTVSQETTNRDKTIAKTPTLLINYQAKPRGVGYKTNPLSLLESKPQ